MSPKKLILDGPDCITHPGLPGLQKQFCDEQMEGVTMTNASLTTDTQTNATLDAIAQGLAYSSRSPVLRTPANVGLDFEEIRSEEHTSELQSRQYLVCRLLLEKKHEHYHVDMTRRSAGGLAHGRSNNTRL